MTDALIWIILAAITFLVLIFIIPNQLNSSAEAGESYLQNTGDYDGDGIINLFDKCDCDPAPNFENGCIDGEEYTKEDFTSCTERIRNNPR